MRRFSRDLAVHAYEVGNAVVAAGQRNLANRASLQKQELLCLGYPRFIQIISEGHTRYFLKASRKVAVAYPIAFGKLFFIDILGVFLLNVAHYGINKARGAVVFCRG